MIVHSSRLGSSECKLKTAPHRGGQCVWLLKIRYALACCTTNGCHEFCRTGQNRQHHIQNHPLYKSVKKQPFNILLGNENYEKRYAIKLICVVYNFSKLILLAIYQKLGFMHYIALHIY